MNLDSIAQIVGYTIIVSGGLAAALWLFWWLVAKVIRQLGFWPLFIQALYQAGQIRQEKRKKEKVYNEY